MTEYDMTVSNHTTTRDAAKNPVYKVTLSCEDPKTKLSIKSGNSALFAEYPLGRSVTVIIEMCKQKTLPAK